jgi:hypothetical protein
MLLGLTKCPKVAQLVMPPLNYFFNLQVVVGGKNKYLINGANIQATVS